MPLPAPILWLLLAILWVVPPEVYPLTAAAVPVLTALLGLVLLASGECYRPGEGWLLAAVAGPLVVSHLFAADTGASVDALVRSGGVFVVFAAARSLSGPARMGTWRLLAVAGAVLAVHGVWQVTFAFDRLLALPDLDPAVATRLATHRVFSRFLLPSTFASFLLLAMPVAAGQALQMRGRGRRLFGAVCLLSVTGLILTQSQGAVLALVAAGVCWAVASGRRAVRAGALGLALVGVLALVAVISWRDGALFEGAGASGPAALRWRNWGAAVHMTLDHPITGVGGNGFGAAYPAYRQPGDNETRFAHNTYLQTVAEHGLPVLVPMAVLLVLCGRSIHRSARRGRPLEAGAAFGLTAFLLHNLWDFPGLLISPLWTAAAVAGVLAGSRRRVAVTPEADGRPGGDPSPGGASVRTPAGWPAWMPLPANAGGTMLLALLMLAGAYVGVRGGLARRHLEAARAAVVDGSVRHGLELARRAERLAPWQAENPLFVAEALLAEPSLASPGQSVAAAVRAVERNLVWPSAHAVQARALAAAGDAGGAAVEIGRAARLYPLDDSYRQELEALSARVVARREAGR